MQTLENEKPINREKQDSSRNADMKTYLLLIAAGNWEDLVRASARFVSQSFKDSCQRYLRFKNQIVKKSKKSVQKRFWRLKSTFHISLVYLFIVWFVQIILIWVYNRNMRRPLHCIWIVNMAAWLIPGPKCDNDISCLWKVDRFGLNENTKM